MNETDRLLADLDEIGRMQKRALLVEFAQAAVLAERERCARLVESKMPPAAGGDFGAFSALQNAAAAIRAGTA